MIGIVEGDVVVADQMHGGLVTTEPGCDLEQIVPSSDVASSGVQDAVVGEDVGEEHGVAGVGTACVLLDKLA